MCCILYGGVVMIERRACMRTLFDGRKLVDWEA